MTERFPRLPTCVLLFSGVLLVQLKWWFAFTTKVQLAPQLYEADGFNDDCVAVEHCKIKHSPLLSSLMLLTVITYHRLLVE